MHSAGSFKESLSINISFLSMKHLEQKKLNY